MRLGAAVLVIVVSVLGLVVGSSSAGAANHQVNMANFEFSPPSVTAQQGDTVKWTNLQPDANHKVVSNQGFWAGPTLSVNQTYGQTAAFKNAGTYGYHCSIHLSMTGVVSVPLKATGSPSAGWQIRWSSLSSRPTTRNFDVQIQRPGSSTWRGFRSAVTALSTSFNPSANGTYRFRARTRIVSNGHISGWSPTRSVSIT